MIIHNVAHNTTTLSRTKLGVPLVGIFKDRNDKYLGFNWHNAFAEIMEECGVPYLLLDPRSTATIEELQANKIDAYIWWPWHHPHDRANAKDKIYFIERICDKYILPNWEMYWHYDNKIRQFYMMQHLGIPMPKTYITFDYNEAMSYARTVTLPVVSKGSSGACGQDVKQFKQRSKLVEFVDEVFSEEGANTSFASIKQKNYVYLQEYLPARGDLRIITIGGRPELAYWRVNDSGWKFNINSGGRVDKDGVPESAVNLAIDASIKMNMHWCACDIMIKKGSPVMTELSATFGIVPPEICTELFGTYHADIPLKQARYFLKALSEKRFDIPHRNGLPKEDSLIKLGGQR